MQRVAKKLCRAGTAVALAVAAAAVPGVAQAAPPIVNFHGEVPESRTFNDCGFTIQSEKVTKEHVMIREVEGSNGQAFLGHVNYKSREVLTNPATGAWFVIVVNPSGLYVLILLNIGRTRNTRGLLLPSGGEHPDTHAARTRLFGVRFEVLCSVFRGFYGFAPDPETLAHAGEPSFPRAVEDHSFEYADQALEAALAQDPLAQPDKWVAASLFTEFFNEELANKVEPEAARIGILGSLVAGVAFLAVLVPLLYVGWFLLDWLGIQDVDGLDFVIFIGLAITGSTNLSGVGPVHAADFCGRVTAMGLRIRRW
jgi:hypothetical protein